MDLTQMSYMTLRRHARVEKSGIPELVQAVQDGKVTVSAAAELTRLSPAEQLEQLNEHLRFGGGRAHKKWMGSRKLDLRPNRMAAAPNQGMRASIRAMSRSDVADDELVAQAFALIHRLREVSAKTTPGALYARVPERLLHNLNLSLEQATDFLICLRDDHRNRMPKKTAE